MHKDSGNYFRNTLAILGFKQGILWEMPKFLRRGSWNGPNIPDGIFERFQDPLKIKSLKLGVLFSGNKSPTKCTFLFPKSACELIAIVNYRLKENAKAIA
jgi:hypothetical protein